MPPTQSNAPAPGVATPARIALAALACAALLAACSPSAPPPIPPVNPEWRLVPEATVLGQDRQFFLYGRKLDSVTVTLPPSVIMRQGPAASQGRVRSYHFKVMPLSGDSLAPGEKPGARAFRFKTLDTTVVFSIKVMDEVRPR